MKLLSVTMQPCGHKAKKDFRTALDIGSLKLIRRNDSEAKPATPEFLGKRCWAKVGCRDSSPADVNSRAFAAIPRTPAECKPIRCWDWRKSWISFCTLDVGKMPGSAPLQQTECDEEYRV